MSRSLERFKKDLLARVKQQSASDAKEKQFLVRKFKYFDRMDTAECKYADFSNVVSRLGVYFTSKKEEFAIFEEILAQQKQLSQVAQSSKTINYVDFIHSLLDIKSAHKSQSTRKFGESSVRNNKTSQMLSVVGSRSITGDVTTSKFEKAVLVVSDGMCEVNLLYVLQHLNKEIKRTVGVRKIDYRGLLTCFMKIGLGFKYEVSRTD